MRLSLAILGFGNVGRAFARLLLHKRAALQAEYGLDCPVVGLMTGRHGLAIDARGIDLDKALALTEAGGSLEALNAVPPPDDSLLFVHYCPADVLIELTPLNLVDGEPAVSHVRAALGRGQHVVTANKGPLAFACRELRNLAARQGRALLFESTVMDGAPLLSVARSGLPAAEVLGFRGVLNSTTNFILTQMEAGNTFEQALGQAQEIGIAETDPSADVDGWDATVKSVVLANVLMGADLRPADVERRGIRDITQAEVQTAVQNGQRIKLVCQGERLAEGVRVRVGPQALPLADPLAHLIGTSSMVSLQTDTLKQLSLLEFEPGPAQTAYGILADLINIGRNWY